MYAGANVALSIFKINISGFREVIRQDNISIAHWTVQ